MFVPRTLPPLSRQIVHLFRIVRRCENSPRLIWLVVIYNSCYGFAQGSHVVITQKILDNQISIVMILDVIMQTEITEVRQRYVII